MMDVRSVRKCNTIIAGRIPLSAVILTLLRSTHLLVYPYQVKDNLGTHMLQASTHLEEFGLAEA